VNSNSLITPPVSLSDIRGAQAAQKVKASSPEGKAKIEKSAKEFEAVLLSKWLEQAEQSFATVPGAEKEDDSDDPGREQFTSISMQAVASALSGRRGGLGIAQMVAKHLESNQSSIKPEDAKPIEIKPLHAIPDSVTPLAPPEGRK
jgi:Rod binding domain-containing protein